MSGSLLYWRSSEFVYVTYVLRWRSKRKEKCWLLYPAVGILESWEAGLYDYRDRPGFQHTLAESLEELLWVTQLENYSYVGKTAERGDELPQCGLLMGNLLGFPALDVSGI